MRIEITLQIDERAAKPYWSGKLIHKETTILEVVSQTFEPKDDHDFARRYQNVCARMMKELSGMADVKNIKALFLLNETT